MTSQRSNKFTLPGWKCRCGQSCACVASIRHQREPRLCLRLCCNRSAWLRQRRCRRRCTRLKQGFIAIIVGAVYTLGKQAALIRFADRFVDLHARTGHACAMGNDCICSCGYGCMRRGYRCGCRYGCAHKSGKPAWPQEPIGPPATARRLQPEGTSRVTERLRPMLRTAASRQRLCLMLCVQVAPEKKPV